jgi:hypothetical protein
MDATLDEKHAPPMRHSKIQDATSMSHPGVDDRMDSVFGIDDHLWRTRSGWCHCPTADSVIGGTGAV